MAEVSIGGRLVGDGHPCYVIAEAGVNHNGDVDLARQLVTIAAEAGADAVKFQKRTPERILTKSALERPYDSPTALAATYGEHRRRLELSPEDYAHLQKDARQTGITLLASAWDEESADFVGGMGVPAFKMASADLTNLPLLRYVAEKGLPMLISTGMSDLSEVAEAMRVVRESASEVVLLQCTSTYPAENNELNLRAISMLREEFDVLVGYSGHERGLVPSVAAVAMGACVVERHFTLDRTMPGPDHAASLEPPGLRTLIRDIRNVEQALGTPEKLLTDRERPLRDRLAKSVVAKRTIPADAVIEPDMLTLKSPGIGIPPSELERVAGSVALVEILEDTLISPQALGWQ